MEKKRKSILDYKFLFRQFVAKGGYNNLRRLRRVNRKRSLFSTIRRRNDDYIVEQTMKGIYPGWN